MKTGFNEIEMIINEAHDLTDKAIVKQLKENTNFPITKYIFCNR